MSPLLRRRARQAIVWTARDLSWGPRLWVINDVAGHWLMPRLLRHVIYRSAQVDIAALDVAAGMTVTGCSGLQIGEDTYINHGVYLEAGGGITIGRRCAIGPEVMILSTNHPVAPAGWSDSLLRTPTTIGDRVWLGARVLVLPGSSIASGCVVSAGSVVRGNLVQTGVYAGHPATLVGRLRPHDDDVESAR